MCVPRSTLGSRKRSWANAEVTVTRRSGIALFVTDTAATTESRTRVKVSNLPVTGVIYQRHAQIIYLMTINTRSYQERNKRTRTSDEGRERR